MHELGITQDLLNIAIGEAERQGARRITSLRLIVGELAGIEPDSLGFCFEVASRGTIAEGAVLEIQREQVTAKCSTCDMTWAPIATTLTCPSCGAGDGEMTGGQDVSLASIEVEQ